MKIAESMKIAENTVITEGMVMTGVAGLHSKTKEQKRRIKNMLEKIQNLVAEGLGVDADKVVPEASFKEDLGADSLDLFELVMSFEDEFGVSIPSEELEKMVTVQDVMNYIESNQQ